MNDGFLRCAAIHQCAGEIVVRGWRFRVFRENGAKTGFGVLIVATLRPGCRRKKEEQTEKRRTAADFQRRCDPLPQKRCARAKRNDNPDDRKILKMVGPKNCRVLT